MLQALFTEMDISTSEREESTPKKLGKIVNKKWENKLKEMESQWKLSSQLYRCQ